MRSNQESKRNLPLKSIMRFSVAEDAIITNAVFWLKANTTYHDGAWNINEEDFKNMMRNLYKEAFLVKPSKKKRDEIVKMVLSQFTRLVADASNLDMLDILYKRSRMLVFLDTDTDLIKEDVQHQVHERDYKNYQAKSKKQLKHLSPQMQQATIDMIHRKFLRIVNSEYREEKFCDYPKSTDGLEGERLDNMLVHELVKWAKNTFDLPKTTVNHARNWLENMLEDWYVQTDAKWCVWVNEKLRHFIGKRSERIVELALKSFKWK